MRNFDGVVLVPDVYIEVGAEPGDDVLDGDPPYAVDVRVDELVRLAHLLLGDVGQDGDLLEGAREPFCPAGNVDAGSHDALRVLPPEDLLLLHRLEHELRPVHYGLAEPVAVAEGLDQVEAVDQRAVRRPEGALHLRLAQSVAVRPAHYYRVQLLAVEERVGRTPHPRRVARPRVVHHPPLLARVDNPLLDYTAAVLANRLPVPRILYY